ncbi:hypothetical protein Aduo_009199 [Ancylostoma duodenale]
MSEAESLGSSSGSDEIAFSQLLASVARPIPQPFVASPWGSGHPGANYESFLSDGDVAGSQNSRSFARQYSASYPEPFPLQRTL